MAEVIPPVKAVYAHGNTVTVTIIRDSDGNVMVSGAACSEIGSTSVFQYQPVFTPPSTKTSYTAIFTNGTYSQTGELVLGGYDYQAKDIVDDFSIPTVSQIRSELDSNSTKLANLDAAMKMETIARMDAQIADLDKLISEADKLGIKSRVDGAIGRIIGWF